MSSPVVTICHDAIVALRAEREHCALTLGSIDTAIAGLLLLVGEPPTKSADPPGVPPRPTVAPGPTAPRGKAPTLIDRLPPAPPEAKAPRADPPPKGSAHRSYTDDEKAAAVALAERTTVLAASAQVATAPPSTAPPTPRPSRIVPSTVPDPDRDKPGPDRPFVCSCGRGFETARVWNQHRNQLPEVDQKKHRLVGQPPAGIVPTGVARPTNDVERARAAAFDHTDDGPAAA